MTIIDSYINVYNHDFCSFCFTAGAIICLIGFIVTLVMITIDFDNGIANVTPMMFGLILWCVAMAITVSFIDSDKNTTCYKVVLEPSFTEEEFNAITNGFFIDSYKDGFWYLEELNPNNEVQKPNTEQERHMFYLIYSGDEGGGGAEPKVESKVESKVEPKVESKVESKVLPKEVHREKTSTEKIFELWHKYRLKMLC